MPTATPTPHRSKRSFKVPDSFVELSPLGTPLHQPTMPLHVLIDGNDSVAPSNDVSWSISQVDSHLEVEPLSGITSGSVPDNRNTSICINHLMLKYSKNDIYQNWCCVCDQVSSLKLMLDPLSTGSMSWKRRYTNMIINSVCMTLRV